MILFMHLHKSAGTFLVNLMKKFSGKDIPDHGGLLRCLEFLFFNDRAGSACMHDQYGMLPFWTWSALDQARFLMSTRYNFIANERWLGPELIPSNISNGKTFKYITIVRNPLDRIVSHYFYAKNFSGSSVQASDSFESFVREGPCKYPDAGFLCWDANYYVQV